MVLTSIPRSTSSLDTRPKYYLVEVPKRVAFTDADCPSNMDHEEDNPFRPGSELSREAEIIVNLIKEGKPITPTGDMTSANVNIETQQQQNQQKTPPNDESFAKRNQTQTQSAAILVKNEDNNINNNAISNGATTIEPGQVEIQHGIIVPSNDNVQTVEQVNLKKKRKCCSIQ